MSQTFIKIFSEQNLADVTASKDYKLIVVKGDANIEFTNTPRPLLYVNGEEHLVTGNAYVMSQTGATVSTFTPCKVMVAETNDPEFIPEMPNLNTDHTKVRLLSDKENWLIYNDDMVVLCKEFTILKTLTKESSDFNGGLSKSFFACDFLSEVPVPLTTFVQEKPDQTIVLGSWGISFNENLSEFNILLENEVSFNLADNLAYYFGWDMNARPINSAEDLKSLNIHVVNLPTSFGKYIYKCPESDIQVISFTTGANNKNEEKRLFILES